MEQKERKEGEGKKKASPNRGGRGLLSDALFGKHRHEEGGTSQWCLKRKPPQRPVKIASSVYCVFDPVGRTAETRRGEAERIVVPT